MSDVGVSKRGEIDRLAGFRDQPTMRLERLDGDVKIGKRDVPGVACRRSQPVIAEHQHARKRLVFQPMRVPPRREQARLGGEHRNPRQRHGLRHPA